MNIYFIYTDTIPTGNAYSNRIMSLAKGLAENNNEVTVLNSYVGCTRNDIDANVYKLYKIGDVRYLNLSGVRKKSNNRIFQIVSAFWGIISTFFYLLFRKNIDHVILCASKLEYIIPFFILSKIRNYKLIREKNEYPQFYLYPDSLRNKFRPAKNSRYNLFDGLILMTHFLEDFFVKNGYKGKIVIIPMTVEFNRFTDIPYSRNNKFITYIGSLNNNKDGILELIESYFLLKNMMNNIDLKLRLIGDNSNEDFFRIIKNKINDCNLQDDILFEGVVKRDAVPSYLKNSKLLVLSRPGHLQAEGGFPTKLGEYLSCGVPIVLTRVGEIEKYLVDGVHALFSDPDNPEMFAEKMYEAVVNSEKANTIGANGLKLAEEIFNYQVQGKRLSDFLAKLN